MKIYRKLRPTSSFSGSTGPKSPALSNVVLTRHSLAVSALAAATAFPWLLGAQTPGKVEL